MSSNLWNKKLKCRFCNHEFETTRMRSSAMKVKTVQTDFGNVYEEECPYFFAVTGCPNCTFTSRNEHFETVLVEYEPKILEASKKLRQPGVPKPAIFATGPMTPEVAAKRLELALAFLKLRNHPDLGETAGLTMHLVWVWRLAGNKENEMAAMLQAIKAYEEFFEKGAKLPEKLGEPGVLYLTGELHRRTGNLKEARRYFERALASKEIKNHSNIENHTRDMMLNVKAEMEKEGK